MACHQSTDESGITRRAFLTATAQVGGAMVLGFWLPPSVAEGQTASGHPSYHDGLVPEINAWITIAPDETVTIRVAQTEMGNGVFTSCPMIVAEELQCDWKKVRAEYASANRNVREKAPEWTIKIPGNGLFDPAGGGAQVINGDFGERGVYRRMVTNSSASVRVTRYYLQQAGAEARERLLTAAANEWKVPVAELVAKDSVITHAKSKRRTTYGAMASKAAQIQLPDPGATITIKPPSKWTLMGTPQKNLDVPLKITGQAMYASDVRLPGMLYAAVKACPVWGGDVRSYDFDKVKGMPGVHSAVKFGGRGRQGHISGGVAIVADTWWHAKTALDAMPIVWETGPSGSASSASLLESHMASFKGAATRRTEVGDVDAAMSRAAKVFEATYTVPYLGHACMEPGSATAMVTPDRVDLWTGTQTPDAALKQAAAETGIAPEKIFVHEMFLGGGYGIDNGNSRANQQAVAIAKALNGRPVKLVWSREEDWGFGLRPRPMGVGIFKAALDANGWPVALDVRTSGANYGGDQQWRGLTSPPYFIPSYRYMTFVPSSHVPVTPRRSTGSSTNSFYLESFVDELAHLSGKDPYLYRRELVARNPIGKPGLGGFLLRNEWLEALDTAAKMSGWGTPLPPGWARGIAIDDRRRGMAQTVNTYTTVVAEVHTIEVSKAGQVRLHRSDVAFDEGFGFVNPLSVRKQIEGQIAWGFSDALYQGVTIKDGRAVEVNFDQYPVSRMSEYPREVNISFFKTNKWLYGVGEEAIPQVTCAIVNAVYQVTKKRIRDLPLKNHDLSWG